jgi:hypothetical protein
MPDGPCSIRRLAGRLHRRFPHAWRDDDLWKEIQTETQERIGTSLREMYADLGRLPLSPRLRLLVRQIKAHRGAPTAHG